MNILTGTLLFELFGAFTQLMKYSLASVKELVHPIVLTGPVTHGFGRGGKLLGCPTANIDYKVLGDKLNDLENGIYFGWARLGGKGEVYGMVTSIGWNPTFANEHKSVEPHLLNNFQEDFYGVEISVVLCGYIRPELAFESLKALIICIEKDKEITRLALSSGKYESFKSMLDLPKDVIRCLQ